MHDTYANSEFWGSMLSGIDIGSGSVISFRFGGSEADGTSHCETVRCPIIGSCMIPMQTLSFGGPLCGLPCGDLVFAGVAAKDMLGGDSSYRE